MALYADLDPAKGLGRDWAADPEARTRVVKRLLALRDGLRSGAEAIPPRSQRTLLLATWNIREFDSEKWGARIPESYAYIAEIIERFDLIAVQEVREDLTALDRLKERLRPRWSYLVSDVTSGTAGNHERLAYLYDQRKVRFLGIAGVSDYYQHVFRDDDSTTYRSYIDEYIKARRTAGQTSPKAPATNALARQQYRDWRTFQMSDHLPLWAEFRVDFADDYLKELQAP